MNLKRRAQSRLFHGRLPALDRKLGGHGRARDACCDTVPLALLMLGELNLT